MLPKIFPAEIQRNLWLPSGRISICENQPAREACGRLACDQAAFRPRVPRREATDRGPRCPAWIERSVISVVEQMKNTKIKKINGVGLASWDTATSTIAFSGNRNTMHRCLPILSAAAPRTGLPRPSINHLNPITKPVKVATPMV